MNASPFVVHSRDGEGVVAESTLTAALRWQETLRGVIMHGSVVVVEAVAS